jgi:Icc-related predicted phosphoesterase
MLKVTALSDLHGILPILIEPFDILLIAGDIIPAYRMYARNVENQKYWLSSEFKWWLERLPFRDEQSKVYIVPGNHDHIFEDMTDSFRKEVEGILGERVCLLVHEKAVYRHTNEYRKRQVEIFGTPYCKIFRNWAFMKPDEELKELYEDIPYGLDILVTHDPPALNDLGVISQGRQKGHDAGNVILADRVLEVKPKYCFCGHIHSGNHRFQKYEDMIMMANVSIVDEDYDPVYRELNFAL